MAVPTAVGIDYSLRTTMSSNTASLQRGARNFVNYCMGCHSAKYVRYNRLGEDLGLSDAQMIENLMFTGERPHDTMQDHDAAAGRRALVRPHAAGSELDRACRGTDYIYTFLKSFYLDPSRPTGTNNLRPADDSDAARAVGVAGLSAGGLRRRRAMLSTMPCTRSSKDSSWRRRAR